MKRLTDRWSLSLLLVVLTAVPHLLRAQQEEVGLRMDLDKRQVAVGDSLTLTLEFKQIGNTNSSIVQEPSIPTSENFEIEGTSSSTRVIILNGQDSEESDTTFHLVATQAGSATLGPASLIYQDANGKRKELQSNIVTVTVTKKTPFSFFGRNQVNPTPTASNAAAVSVNTDLRGIKGLPPESFSWIGFIFWLVVLLVIIGFVWRQFRKKPMASKMVGSSKEEELRLAWKKLSNDNLSSKEFALGLSNLVRECLQYRFGFPALDNTTEEIMMELSRKKLSEAEKSAAEKCLKTADRVLYADGSLAGRDTLRNVCSVLLPKINKN